MTSEPLTTFAFSSEGQTAFAALSGDWNPMHMSAVFARRTQAGRAVVHGIHTLLRMLDAFAASSPDLPLPSRLSVRFPAPVYVDDTVAIHSIARTDRQIRLQARIDDTITADLKIVPGHLQRPRVGNALSSVDRDVACREISLVEMTDRSGVVHVATGASEIQSHFPYVSEWLGVERVAGLLALSRLVGMECPGKHSLFVGLAVDLPLADPASSLLYQVTSVDDRFRMLTISVDGLGIRGSVEAFARHPPVAQESIQKLSTLIEPGEFVGQRALIVGGSRGLGELTAKLIAAGGGHPIITYAVGKDDAERVSAEIEQWGGACDILKYDARCPPEQQLNALSGRLSSVYYYATCQIFRRRTNVFDAAILDEFVQLYVRGFHDLCEALRGLAMGSLSVFYPSSVFVEDRPRDMTEYAMAKAAGEILCAEINRSWATMHITSSRLPRLLTDQTAAFVAVESASGPSTILPIVREVQSHRF